MDYWQCVFHANIISDNLIIVIIMWYITSLIVASATTLKVLALCSACGCVLPPPPLHSLSYYHYSGLHLRSKGGGACKVARPLLTNPLIKFEWWAILNWKCFVSQLTCLEVQWRLLWSFVITHRLVLRHKSFITSRGSDNSDWTTKYHCKWWAFHKRNMKPHPTLLSYVFYNQPFLVHFYLPTDTHE